MSGRYWLDINIDREDDDGGETRLWRECQYYPDPASVLQAIDEAKEAVTAAMVARNAPNDESPSYGAQINAEGHVYE